MNYENRVPAGGCRLNVYSEGSGSSTIVFLAGNGVTSPVLEYKPLYRRLSRIYRIAVIERAGCGFSDPAKTPRTVENIVSENREALCQAGIAPPYILAAHSIAGIEAVWWANTYPEEITAILGVDMGVPGYALEQSEALTERRRLSMAQSQQKLSEAIAKDGFIARVLRNKSENVSGLLSGDELDTEEKRLYRELYYKNIANKEFLEMTKLMPENAQKAVDTGALRCISCLYISDLKMPGMKHTWRQAGIAFAEKFGGEYHLSDKGHMMYAYIPEEMAQTFDTFLRAHNITE